jgi:hypothetical protein
MLTEIEIEFLKSQGLAQHDVYDGRGQSKEEWRAAAKSEGKILVLGTPCGEANHRLRTRSGHCVQCNSKKIAFQERHNSVGYVYIAGSMDAKLIKIGTAIDIEQRLSNLRHQAYGGIRDWEMLFTAKVTNSGKTEGEALSQLKQSKITRAYSKDGNEQEASELLKTNFTKAINAVGRAIGHEQPQEVWNAVNWRDFDFD